MKRGTVFVRAQDETGRWGTADALDIDDDSFRAFVLDRLVYHGLVAAIGDEYVVGDRIRYRTRPGVRFRRDGEDPATGEVKGGG